MTIDNEMIDFVNEMILQFGAGYVISRKEITSEISGKYGRAIGSILPSDYCYNRINNGVAIDKLTVFEYLGYGDYKCLGANYPFNGTIYHKPKGSKIDIPVGECKNGKRKLN